jgi:hypothetical protein
MNARSDVHRPAELRTEDYEYVGAYDSRPEWPLTGPAAEYRVYLLRLLGSASAAVAHRDDHEQCDHCGAHLRYVAVLKHIPTGDHLSVGETCLENRFSRASADFHALRREAKLDRERAAARESAAAYRADNVATVDGAPVDWAALDASENEFVRDVLAKLAWWGTLSDRQLSAIVAAVKRDAERAESPEEVWLDVPVWTGEVTGEVLTTKWQDSQFGGALKMLVKVPSRKVAGAAIKVWGTVPRAIAGQVERGDVVTFTADIRPSDRDSTFGLFSRPRGARVAPRGDGGGDGEAEAM